MNSPANAITNRERLLLAAREVFLAHGYDASVDAIIREAGVARQTFYNHFQNKESLFAEVVKDCFLDIMAPLAGHTDDLRLSLQNFATIYRQRALSPQGIAAYRMLSSQVQRFPAMVREVYELGTGRMMERLADFLREAMEGGLLRKTDPVFAAELLISMLVGQERSQLLFGIQRPPEEESLKVKRVLDCFMQLFGDGRNE
jgi:TetR/AcrR family transcriptional regulator, mexJK operon transcriptional repressor